MWIEEELTLAEFSERFINNSNFDTPVSYDLSNHDIEVETLDKNGKPVFRPVTSFLVKNNVDKYYTDGKIKVTGNHRFVESGNDIHAKDHPEFHEVSDNMQVVDIEVDGEHTYLANGRLNHNTTSGGKGLAFHSSVRLRLKNMGQIKDKSDRIIGIKVRAQVIKNRIGPPLRSTDFEIYFDRGIDNHGSWLKIMKDNKIAKMAGAWYTYVDVETGEEHKFQAKEFSDLLEAHPELEKQIYERICEETILSYKTNTRDTSEYVVDTKGAGIDD